MTSRHSRGSIRMCQTPESVSTCLVVRRRRTARWRGMGRESLSAAPHCAARTARAAHASRCGASRHASLARMGAGETLWDRLIAGTWGRQLPCRWIRAWSYARTPRVPAQASAPVLARASAQVSARASARISVRASAVPAWGSAPVPAPGRRVAVDAAERAEARPAGARPVRRLRPAVRGSAAR